jgi:predicted SprT family Zn-dependent metalloprotease
MPVRKHLHFEKYTFIESLSVQVENESLRDQRAIHFMKHFNKKKERSELLKECYDLFNCAAFDSKLPHEMKLEWNAKLSSTGGYCKNRVNNLTKERSCEIHISTKVCNTPERMRDTLAHEMCHAAAFLIDGLCDGHGKIWRSWANRVNFAFKRIPRITVTHSYSIDKKYIYRCIKCLQE